ncbi:MAG: hypothetical protein AB1706_14525 [Pseudomonadota bacterium]
MTKMMSECIHSQPVEHKKFKVFANYLNSNKQGTGFVNGNGFGYFCRNKSNVIN